MFDQSSLFLFLFIFKYVSHFGTGCGIYALLKSGFAFLFFFPFRWLKKGKVSLTHQGKAGESLFGIRWKWWNGRVAAG
jgi:hypothetical protein